jgi:RNA-directed DNA polymerase
VNSPVHSISEAPISPKVTFDDSKSRLMEVIFSRENLLLALERVERNNGAPGVDGIKVSEFRSYLKENWLRDKEKLFTGAYKPNAVRKVEIPKPAGGIRILGIPTVLDRLIQQAILQVLTPIFEPKFSEASFGFRPGKSAHDALKAALAFQNEGFHIVVDIDLEKFFDNVNHDILMHKLSLYIQDRRVLRLIRSYLTAGIMSEGIESYRSEGTPQGSPLSPLLSNVMLDEMDKELERRKLHFARYADDCNIYVKTKTAGKRILLSIRKFLNTRLRLNINEGKSAVAIATSRNFLGYSFYRKKGTTKFRCAKESTQRFKNRVRILTQGHRQISLKARIATLNPFLRGWINYFKLTETPKILKEIDAWIRRRLRMCLLKLWRLPKTRYKEIVKLGAKPRECFPLMVSKQYWRLSNAAVISVFLNVKYFERNGLMNVHDTWQHYRKKLPTAGYGSVRPVV